MKDELVRRVIDGETFEIQVEHYSISDGIKLAEETIESIECCERLGYKYIDSSVYVLYKDGREYFNGEGGSFGKFRKTNARTIIIDCEGHCYQLAGKYMIDENLCPQAI